jgi:type IV secretory pathway TraG/TraD family ATPase VirD4
MPTGAVRSLVDSELTSGTQSIASMAYRLQNEPGGGKNALDIILNNCGNAMYFRTSDIQTQNNVQSRIPAPRTWRTGRT